VYACGAGVRHKSDGFSNDVFVYSADTRSKYLRFLFRVVNDICNVTFETNHALLTVALLKKGIPEFTLTTNSFRPKRPFKGEDFSFAR